MHIETDDNGRPIPPDFFGGYSLFAIMDDGGTLCELCTQDESNPVHADPTLPDGWQVIAWDLDGNGEGFLVCDHCGRTIREYDELVDGPAN